MSKKDRATKKLRKISKLPQIEDETTSYSEHWTKAPTAETLSPNFKEFPYSSQTSLTSDMEVLEHPIEKTDNTINNSCPNSLTDSTSYDSTNYFSTIINILTFGYWN